MAKRTDTLRCPTCKKLVLRSDAEFPFCSERCRVIDLGKWASEGYVISSPVSQGDASGDVEYLIERRRVAAPTSEDTNDDTEKRR